MSATLTNDQASPRLAPSGSPLLRTGHTPGDPQAGLVGADLLAINHPQPDTHEDCVGGDLLRTDHRGIESPTRTVGADLLDPGQKFSDSHSRRAGVDLLAIDHCRPGTEQSPAGGDLLQSAGHPRPAVHGPDAGWLELRIWAEMFNDAQLQRIASTNRAERGGVDGDVYAAFTEALQKAEDICRLHLKRCYRRVVPTELVAWQKATHGIGDSNLARLLGHLGHPVWATPHHWDGTGAKRTLITDEPYRRTVAQLWQYCGHGDPARSRPRKGMTAEQLAAIGSPTLKMLVHLNAEACMKVRSSPFRLVYEQERESCTGRMHSVECVRCGPSGKPAQVGTPWSLGHQHAHALRIVGKEILRDLWIVAGGGARVRPNPNDAAPLPGDNIDPGHACAVAHSAIAGVELSGAEGAS